MINFHNQKISFSRLLNQGLSMNRNKIIMRFLLGTNQQHLHQRVVKRFSNMSVPSEKHKILKR